MKTIFKIHQVSSFVHEEVETEDESQPLANSIQENIKSEVMIKHTTTEIHPSEVE